MTLVSPPPEATARDLTPPSVAAVVFLCSFAGGFVGSFAFAAVAFFFIL